MDPWCGPPMTSSQLVDDGGELEKSMRSRTILAQKFYFHMAGRGLMHKMALAGHFSSRLDLLLQGRAAAPLTSEGLTRVDFMSAGSSTIQFSQKPSCNPLDFNPNGKEPYQANAFSSTLKISNGKQLDQSKLKLPMRNTKMHCKALLKKMKVPAKLSVQDAGPYFENADTLTLDPTSDLSCPPISFGLNL